MMNLKKAKIIRRGGGWADARWGRLRRPLVPNTHESGQPRRAIKLYQKGLNNALPALSLSSTPPGRSAE